MPTRGPHLVAAVICERAITEGDGVISLIRVIDRVTTSATGVDPPEVMPAITASLQMVVMLKADEAKGRYTIKLVIEDPSGERKQVGEQDVNLKPGNQGANLMIGLNMTLGREGVYWIDVMFGGPHGQDDERLTRTPLEVVYQRQRIPESPSQP